MRPRSHLGSETSILRHALADRDGLYPIVILIAASGSTDRDNSVEAGRRALHAIDERAESASDYRDLCRPRRSDSDLRPTPVAEPCRKTADFPDGPRGSPCLASARRPAKPSLNYSPHIYALPEAQKCRASAEPITHVVPPTPDPPLPRSGSEPFIPPT